MINFENYKKHLSKNIGNFSVTGKVNLNLHDIEKFEVLQFDNVPESKIITYVSSGLSKTQLSAHGNFYREELLMALPVTIPQQEVLQMFAALALEMFSRHEAFYDSEILGPRGPLFERFMPTSLLVALPFYFSEDLFLYEEENCKVIVVWMIPLLDSEVDFIKQGNLDEFKESLYSKKIDIFNLKRQ